MSNYDELTKIKHTLTSIRSEHAGKDVWIDFVVPRFFKQEDFISKQPARIEGSRGTGKTMLLRYLSYQSQFSQNRSTIPGEAVTHVGLYWKADTQFLRMMDKRGIDEPEWIGAFDHYLSLKLALEAINSIFTIAESQCDSFSLADLDKIILKGISDYAFGSENLASVRDELKSKIRKSEMLIQNVKGLPGLEVMPSTFLLFVIESIKNFSELFSPLNFYVYVDEYENLLSYQQKVINTRIKSSEPPLTFNIAIKLNGMAEQQTLGDEKIENRADFIVINLDTKVQENSYQLFLAEILLKRLSDVSTLVSDELGFDPKILNDVGRLAEREDSSYKKQCMDLVSSILKERSSSDLAGEVFSTPAYIDKLNSEIEKGLQAKGVEKYTVDDFIKEDFKKASIVCSSLIHRNSVSVEELSLEVSKMEKGEDNKFTNKTEWEDNNFIGCYLRLVSTYKKKNTFYSGFKVYCHLSAGNVRHFLELCRSAFSLISEKDVSKGIFISNELQHLAARNASEGLFKEIQRFTPLGLKLSKLAEGLGVLFYECQARPQQSETEITHFGIKNKNEVLTESDQILLAEAEKWGVLKLNELTKEKSPLSTGLYDYVLNPIYAPKFFISYRKGRKFELTLNELRALAKDGKGAVSDILKTAVKAEEKKQEKMDEQKQGRLL
jgi:hypothetical protein